MHMHVSLYRGVLRVLRQSVGLLAACLSTPFSLFWQVQPPRRVNPTITAHFRSLAERVANDNDHVRQDFENAVNFLRAQREHNVSSIPSFVPLVL